ncbi:MAG: FtsQ-type POTRA domain-containing protein, partial [Acidobacteriaceae bacterium]
IRDIPDPVLEETAHADLSDAEAREPFLRARNRVAVRRRRGSRFSGRFGWKSRWTRIAAVLVSLAVLGLIAGVAWEAESVLLHDPHFRLSSAQSIQITGNRVVANAQVLAPFTPDLGHSIVSVPLTARQTQLEKIRWVRRATVMRLWPNRLRVNVLERTPIAFARDGNSIRLVDEDGVLLDLPNAAAQHYSFPVLTGVSGALPLSIRAAQLALYREFTQALDAGGGNISQSLSQVDLSDAEDVRAMFTGGTRQPLVHFGVSDFLPRYQAYRAHLTAWLQQYPQLRSVDMRYGRQVVLDTGAVPESAAASATIKETPEPKPAAFPPDAAAPIRASALRVSPANKKAILAPSKRKVIANPHAAARLQRHTQKPVRKHTQKHGPKRTTPERGHPVRHPLMHVVTGP